MLNEPLAERLRDFMISRNISCEEKRMFGGIAFMVGGNMCVGVTNKGNFMVRIHPSETEQALKRNGARQMDFTGRPMKGFLFIENEGYESDTDLEYWIKLSLQFVLSLPAKEKKMNQAKIKTRRPKKK